MPDNGKLTVEQKIKLEVLEKRIKELELRKEEKEAREELSNLYLEKNQITNPPQQPKEWKIAEIWIKEGQLLLDASPEFWMDKLRALGVLEMCKDIVKNYQEQKPKIIPANNQMMNFARKIFKKK